MFLRRSMLMGGGLWTPEALPNLLAWFDPSNAASLTIVNTNQVSQWRPTAGALPAAVPISGASSNVTWNATALSSTYPGVTFGGSANVLRGVDTGAVTGNNPSTLAGVSIATGANTKHAFIGHGSPGTTTARVAATGQFIMSISWNTDWATTVAGNVVRASVHYFGSNNGPIHVDGALTPDATDTNTLTTTSSGFYLIGSDVVGGGNHLTGSVGDLVICNTQLSTSDRQKLEGFMMWKYGRQASLPVGHPYKTVRPQL